MSQFVPCLNSITIKQAPLLEKLEIAASTGYRAVELWNNELAEYEKSGGSLSEVRRRLDDAGLAVGTIVHLPDWMNATGERKQQVWEQCREILRRGREIGAPYAVAGPPMGPCDLDLAARNYYELCELGREMGVKPAAEFLGFVEGVHDIPTLMSIVDKANHPDGTVVIDFFHMVRGGSTLQDLQAVPAEKIAIVHLDDAPGHIPFEQQSDADRVLPGDGAIDLPAMFKALKDMNYRGLVSLELFNPSYWAMDPRELARLGFEKSRPLLGL